MLRKQLALGGAILAILIISQGCNQSGKVEKLVAEGERLLAQNELTPARDVFLKANDLDFENLESLLGLGKIYLKRGQLRQAYSAFNRFLELEPNNAEATMLLAETYLRAGKSDKAETYAIKALQVNPTITSTLITFAKASQGPSEGHKGLQFLDQILSPVDPFPDLLTAKAILNTEMGRYPTAVSLLNQSLEIDHKNYEAILALANLYWRQGEKGQATKYFELSIERSPVFSSVALQASKFHESMGDETKALEILEKAAIRQNDNIPTLKKLATFYERLERFEDAIKQTTQILKIEPDNPEALLLDGQLKISAGLPQEALKPLQKLAKSFPSSAKVQLQLGIAYLNTDSPQLALQHLTKAQYASPDSTEANLLLAGLEVQEANFVNAIIYLRDYLKRNPKNLEVKTFLGKVLQIKGDHQTALKLFLEILSEGDDSPDIHLSIANSYVHLKQPENAYHVLKECISIYPSFFPAIEQLTLIDAARDRFDLANDRLDVYADKIGRNANYTLVKGALAITEGKSDEAEALLQETIETDPTESRAYLILADALIAKNRIDEAITKLSAAVEAKAASKESLMILGSLLEQKHEYGQAAKCYETIISETPDFHPALNNLAYIYANQFKDLDRALELAEKARLLNPANPDIADTLGWILFKKGEFIWAKSILSEAASKLPYNAEIHYHFGSALYMLGQETGAKNSLERALSLSESFDGKADTLEKLKVLNTDPRTSDPSQIEFLESQIRAYPGDIIAQLIKSDIYSNAGKLTEAEATIQFVMNNAPDNPAAITRLASIKETQGLLKQAFVLSKQAYSINQEYPPNLPLLARLAYRLGDQAWATSLYERLIKSNDSDINYSYELAKSYLATSKTESAVNALLNGSSNKKSEQLAILIANIPEPNLTGPLNLDDDDPLLEKIQSALIYHTSKKHADALTAYLRLLEFFPKALFAEDAITQIAQKGAIHNNKTLEIAGNAYHRNSLNPNLALGYAYQAYHANSYTSVVRALDPFKNLPTAQFYLGLAKAKSDKPQDAIELLNSALQSGLNKEEQQLANAAINELKQSL